MFTGIIEEIGRVASVRGAELAIDARLVVSDIALGDSIAVNGVCLTAIAFDGHSFRVQVSPETFEKSTLGGLRPGDRVNLERAMSPNRRFGGHFVQGHVDGVGQVTAVQDQGEFQVWHFRAPRHVAQYLIPKGSIAIEGISLTVVNPTADVFSVAIIPATLDKTILRDRKPGDRVNMEADMIGKHIFHFMQQGKKEPINLNFLKQHGFAQEA